MGYYDSKQEDKVTAGNSTGNSSKSAMKTHNARRDIGLESAGFAAGEIASIGTGLGVIAVMDKVIPKSMMDKATSAVAKVVIAPYLDTIERNLSKCKLKECQVDESKTREERACRLAKGVVVFGSAWLISVGVKLGVRKWAIKEWKIAGGEHQHLPENATTWQKIKSHIPLVGSTFDANMITLADEGVHIGSLIYLNTKASDFTDSHIDKLSKTLEKAGVTPQKAKDLSTMAMVWEVPNVLGLMAGGTAIFGKHAYGWPSKHKQRSFTEVFSENAKSNFTPHL